MNMDEIVKTGLVTLAEIGNIGVLRIDNGYQNRLDKLSFLDIDIIDRWIRTNDLIGLVVSSKGRHFSSGVNIDYLIEISKEPHRFRQEMEKFHGILAFIEALPIVTVAAIPGVCFGGGLEIALACQFRFCSENALFAFPETNRDIMPGGAGTIRLPRLIGFRNAIKMILSGNSISAERAEAIGLVDGITRKKEIMRHSLAFIKDLIQHKQPRVIRHAMKSLVNHCNGSSAEKQADDEITLFMQLVQTLETRSRTPIMEEVRRLI